MRAKDPTFLGLVTSVSGPTVTVSLAESLASGIAMIEGHMYRVAQVGGFVRIPQGYQDLFGIVSEVGASADSKAASGGRWMKVELAGEALGQSFERGLSQLPSINDAVHIVSEGDLKRIYGNEGGLGVYMMIPKPAKAMRDEHELNIRRKLAAKRFSRQGEDLADLTRAQGVQIESVNVDRGTSSFDDFMKSTRGRK